MPNNNNLGKKILENAAVVGATAVLKETMGESVEYCANEATSGAIAINESLDQVGNEVAGLLGDGIGDVAGSLLDGAGDMIQGAVELAAVAAVTVCSIL